jgi:hypothetical protein
MSLSNDAFAAADDDGDMPTTSAASAAKDSIVTQRTAIDLSDFILLLKSSYSKARVDSANVEDKFSSVSFLLGSFDNVVGPMVVHYWHIKEADEKYILGEEILKYIAVRLLNSELHDDKLGSLHKFRYYMVREIERVIFSIFFEASSLSNEYSSGSSQAAAAAASENKVPTSLNCLSMIIPLVYNDEFFFDYLEDTRFLINAIENYIIEYKVHAHLKQKVDEIEFLYILRIYLFFFCRFS